MTQSTRTATRMTAPERREQLLDVTTEIASAQGFRSVTIDGVARAAGISRAIVYEHFGDLPGLLDSVVEREMERALAQVSETQLAELTEGPPVELMIQSLRSFLQAARTHPTTWRLVLTPPAGAPELLQERIEQGRAAVQAKMADAVRPAFPPGTGSPDAELTARILSTIADEYARLVLEDEERYPPERLLEHARWILERASLGEVR